MVREIPRLRQACPCFPLRHVGKWQMGAGAEAAAYSLGTCLRVCMPGGRGCSANGRHTYPSVTLAFPKVISHDLAWPQYGNLPWAFQSFTHPTRNRHLAGFLGVCDRRQKRYD